MLVRIKFKVTLFIQALDFLATLFIFALGYRPTLLGHTTG